MGIQNSLMPIGVKVAYLHELVRKGLVHENIFIIKSGIVNEVGTLIRGTLW